MTSRLTLTPLSCGRAPVVTPTLMLSLIARVAPTRRAAARAGRDVEAVDAKRPAQFARKRRYCRKGWKPHWPAGSPGRPDRLPEGRWNRIARKNLVLRQARLRRDRKCRLGRGPGHRDARRDVRRARFGDEIELGNHVAMESHLSLGESEPLAEKRERCRAAGRIRRSPAGSRADPAMCRLPPTSA